MKITAKILSVIMVLVLVATALPMGVAAAGFEHYYFEPMFFKGDANLDNEITIKDVTAIQKHLAQIIELNTDAIRCADVDNNSELTIKDATQIQKYLANIIEDFDNPDNKHESNDYDYILGETIWVDIKDIGGADVLFEVEEAGYYKFEAISLSDMVGFQFIIEDCNDFGKNWFSESDGNNEYVYALLSPGEYRADFDTFYAEDLTVQFKGDFAEDELPFDADKATELKLGDRIDIKSAEGKKYYKINAQDISYYNMWSLYTEGENPDVYMVCYDETFAKVSESYPYKTTDDPNQLMKVPFYGDDCKWLYVIVECSDKGSDFTLCVETEFDLIKAKAEEATMDETYEIMLVSLEEFSGDSGDAYLASDVFKFVPHKSGYYSFKYSAMLPVTVVQWLYNNEDDSDAHVYANDMDEKEGEEIRYLEAGIEYYISYYLEGEIKFPVEFKITESTKEKFEELHPEEIEPSTEDEEIIDVNLGDSVEISLDYYRNEYDTLRFTATEDCEIVIFSEGSVDAVVYVYDEEGTPIWMADDVYVLNSKDFVAKGTLEKGETCYFEVGTFYEGADNYIFKILDSKDYVPQN